MGHHIDSEGRFQSDKYPELGPDKIVVSFRHPEARVGLSALADGYAAPGPRQDVELAADIRVRLASIGHCGKSEQPGGNALGDCNFPGSCECLCVCCRRARRGMCDAAPPLARAAGDLAILAMPHGEKMAFSEAWPPAIPMGEVVSAVVGPDGLFFPGYTCAAMPLVQAIAAASGYRLVREMVAQAVATCLRDAMAAGWEFEKGDKRSWWGAWGADGLQLAVGVYRHVDDDSFIGILMTVDEARRNGGPF